MPEVDLVQPTTYVYFAIGVSLSSAQGFTLPESPTPYQFCVDLDGSPSGSDLTVTVTTQELPSSAVCKY